MDNENGPAKVAKPCIAGSVRAMPGRWRYLVAIPIANVTQSEV
jgi:hypothetical protein